MEEHNYTGQKGDLRGFFLGSVRGPQPVRRGQNREGIQEQEGLTQRL